MMLTGFFIFAQYTAGCSGLNICAYLQDAITMLNTKTNEY